MKGLRDKYCIVGVGETEYSRSSGRTTRAMAVEEVRAAILDAGPNTEIYFNRTDVQKAINAPPTDWNQCVNGVFRNPATNKTVSDQSIGPAQNDVLKRVIEYTNNTLIGSGNLDMLLSTNGTLLAIQNVTVSDT